MPYSWQPLMIVGLAQVIQPRRGEVYLVSLDPTVGAEIRKPRPAVVVQNDPGDKFYIIVRGKVDVWRSDEQGNTMRVAGLQDGDYFGEITLITGFPRIATVRRPSARSRR